MMVTDQFAQVFREEHRSMLNLLLNLLQAYQELDRPRIQILLAQTVKEAGPHFQYEEEGLYPALVPILGQEYIEELLRAHDCTIEVFQRLAEVAAREPFQKEDGIEATRLIRRILPHLSDCEGLSLIVERMDDDGVGAVLDARERALAERVDLLEWAEHHRRRPAVAPHACKADTGTSSPERHG